jgi:hypothetical protein
MNTQKIICLAVELKSFFASDANHKPFGVCCRSPGPSNNHLSKLRSVLRVLGSNSTASFDVLSILIVAHPSDVQSLRKPSNFRFNKPPFCEEVMP